MAVGGMIGGGMFATLGLMLDVAGPAAWISFVLAGAAAFATAQSYAALTAEIGQGGGIFRFLVARGRTRLALFVVATLIAAYTLSIAVYAYTFGAYIAAVFPAAPWLVRALAGGSILAVLALNLAGATQASLAEILAVCIKLVSLYAIALVGLVDFASGPFVPRRIDLDLAGAVLLGAATVFMAFQGFQLLTYDREDLQKPEINLARAFRWGIATTTLTYILVTLAAVLLVGVETIIEDQETALNTIGRAAFGEPGLYLMVGVAGLATVTAINATLFATARLARLAAREIGLGRSDGRDAGLGLSPFLIALALAALALSLFGGVQELIRCASFLFLLVFAAVNLLALRGRGKSTIAALSGLALTVIFMAALGAQRFG